MSVPHCTSDVVPSQVCEYYAIVHIVNGIDVGATTKVNPTDKVILLTKEVAVSVMEYCNDEE